MPREEPPTWDQSCQQQVGPGKSQLSCRDEDDAKTEEGGGAGRRRTRMTAFVAPVLPFAFSRWGICNDMVGMGIVFVVGDEEGGGRRRRWRCGQESGEGPEAWRFEVPKNSGWDPAAAWHKLMWDHLQKKSSGQGLAGEEWSVPTGPLGSWGHFEGSQTQKPRSTSVFKRSLVKCNTILTLSSSSPQVEMAPSNTSPDSPPRLLDCLGLSNRWPGPAMPAQTPKPRRRRRHDGHFVRPRRQGGIHRQSPCRCQMLP